MFDLSNYPLAVIFSIGLAAILIVSEIARAVGADARLHLLNGPDTLRSSARCVIERSQRDRHDGAARRLLPEPQRSEMKLLPEYVQIRLDIARRGTTLAELTPAVDRSNALQEALWQQAKAMASKDKGAVPTRLFISRSMR